MSYHTHNTYRPSSAQSNARTSKYRRVQNSPFASSKENCPTANLRRQQSQPIIADKDTKRLLSPQDVRCELTPNIPFTPLGRPKQQPIRKFWEDVCIAAYLNAHQGYGCTSEALLRLLPDLASKVLDYVRIGIHQSWIRVYKDQYYFQQQREDSAQDIRRFVYNAEFLASHIGKNGVPVTKDKLLQSLTYFSKFRNPKDAQREISCLLGFAVAVQQLQETKQNGVSFYTYIPRGTLL